MKLVFANRASNILYDFLMSNHTDKPYLLPANVCPIVPETFVKANTPFEFIDIDATHAMDQTQCAQRLSKGDCAGVLFVHAYGHAFDNAQYYAELKKQQADLIIIDDKCLLPPSFTEQDSNADLTLYSSGYAKYVELGYGGWGLVGDGRTYQQCLPEEEYLQMDKEAYQQKVLSEIANVCAHKQCINAIYHAELKDLSDVKLWVNYWDWRCMIAVPAEVRQAVLDAIFAHGYFAGTNYPSQAWNFKEQHCPVAEQEAKDVINLFNDFRANEDFALGVCKAIKEVLK